MVRRAYRQRTLIEVLLPDSDKLWDPALRRIDTLLDDEILTDRMADALARRYPQSQRRGRYGTPATVVLRMLVLKHFNDWSFDESERQVRGSLVYRAFCRIDGERVPDAKTLVRLSQLLDEAVLKDVLARLVEIGRRDCVLRGRRLRVDTTVVETNIHHPTDRTLLADGARVVTRTRQRLGHGIRNRTRSIARRVFEIAQRCRALGVRTPPAKREQSKARMKDLYRGLLRIARAVVRDAQAAGAPWPRRLPPHRRRLLEQLHATPGVGRAHRASDAVASARRDEVSDRYPQRPRPCNAAVSRPLTSAPESS